MAQATQEYERKKEALGQSVQPLPAIEGGSGEEQVDSIADCTLTVVG